MARSIQWLSQAKLTGMGPEMIRMPLSTSTGSPASWIGIPMRSAIDARTYITPRRRHRSHRDRQPPPQWVTLCGIASQNVTTTTHLGQGWRGVRVLHLELDHDRGLLCTAPTGATSAGATLQRHQLDACVCAWCSDQLNRRRTRTAAFVKRPSVCTGGGGGGGAVRHTRTRPRGR
jgi:hypothetical protein